MKITKFDPFLGKNVTIEVPITSQQYAEVIARVVPIQQICPDLSSEYREFLISGISPQGWHLYEQSHE